MKTLVTVVQPRRRPRNGCSETPRRLYAGGGRVTMLGVMETPADDEAARARYERLVAEYEERTGKPGVHWEQLSELERQYWIRVGPELDEL